MDRWMFAHHSREDEERNTTNISTIGIKANRITHGLQSKISEKLGLCGRQKTALAVPKNLGLGIGSAVKAISSLGIQSLWNYISFVDPLMICT